MLKERQMRITTTKLTIIAAALLLSTTVHAAGTAINETGEMPDASAILDARSTTKGFLPPRMTESQRTAIATTPSAAGLQVFQTDGTVGLYVYNGSTWSMVGSGSVSSVGLTLPSIFSVSNSPVTGTGTLTATLASQAANTVLVAPNGSAGAPTFRALLAADIPTLNQNSTGTAANVTGVVAAANGGTGQSLYTIGDLLYASTTTALSKLSDAATGNALISGGAGAAPSYGKIGLSTHVSGTLPVTNGGTGTGTTFTQGSVAFAGTSGVYSQDNSNLFWDATNHLLGIGTATPNYKLDLSGGAFAVRAGLSNSSTRPAVATTRIAGEIAGVGAIPAIDDGFLRLSAGGGTNTYAKVFIDLSGYSTVADMNDNITFGTYGTERMRIDDSGNTMLGTTRTANPVTSRTYGSTISNSGMIFSRAATTSGAMWLGIDGNSSSILQFFTDNGSAAVFAGYVSVTGSTATYNSVSDVRLKENIVPTLYGLDDLMKIQIVDFNFISDTNKEKVNGVIAQDLKQIYPDAVTVGGDDVKTKPWAVDYGRMTPLIVKSVQELKAENDTLRGENEVLKTRLLKIEKTLGL
jgi:hypothetical protein